MRRVLRCRHCGTAEVVELDTSTGEMVRTRPEIEWSQIDDAVWLACSRQCREHLEPKNEKATGERGLHGDRVVIAS
jgi:hypothetical protein